MLFFKITLAMFVAPLTVDATTETARSINEFSITMYHEISQTVKDNIIYSPFSMNNAFAMLRIGSKNNTKNELDKVFHWNKFDKVLEEINKLYSEITERKANHSFLAIGNKIWVDEEFKLLKTYVEEIHKSFKVKPEREPFKTSAEAVRAKMNRWVEEQTNNAIKDLFPKGSISASTKLVLSNAIYFNATWQNPFDTADTTVGDFYKSSGGAMKAHYMISNSYYAIHVDGANDASLLEIPYSGDRFSMIFVRPNNPSGLNKLEKKLNYNILTSWISALKVSRDETEIRIPKFEFQQSLTGVKGMLENMGLNDLFSAGTADLSGINGKKDLFCSSVVHKAYIKVDEKGTTAAAATGVIVGVTSIREKRKFNLDRSFLFYIIDRKNDIVIFTGRVINPSVSKSVVSLRQVQEAERNNMAAMCFSSYITFLLPVMMTYLLSWI